VKTALSKATSFSRRLNHVQFFQLLLMCYAGANPASDTIGTGYGTRIYSDYINTKSCSVS